VTRIGVVSVAEALDSATIAIRAAGSPSARLDAELLLADAIGGSRERLILEPAAPLESDAARTFRSHVRRRSAQREPVAYIVGSRAFRRLDIGVDARVLVPRPETELLVELAAGALASGVSVLDCCCGSGAVALALKDERGDLAVSGSDLDRGALEVAAANSQRLGLEIEWLQADLLERFQAGRFDAVVANPPYVASDEIAALEPEVSRHEPRLALDGGSDGLATLARLIAQAGAAGVGTLILEHGEGQADAVHALCEAAGYSSCERHRDLAGIERALLARR
jgi:release factor glutamine methyltransferase